MNVPSRLAPVAPPSPAPAATRAGRILVADDERSLRELLAIVLRREGYDVMLAENGKMALAALSRGAVDLLISDIKMPDMSGVEVLRSAKQIDPALPAIMTPRGRGAQIDDHPGPMFRQLFRLGSGVCDRATRAVKRPFIG